MGLLSPDELTSPVLPSWACAMTWKMPDSFHSTQGALGKAPEGRQCQRKVSGSLHSFQYSHSQNQRAAKHVRLNAPAVPAMLCLRSYVEIYFLEPQENIKDLRGNARHPQGAYMNPGSL